MVSRVFNKSRVGNVGKLVLVFSVFVAQLLPLPQAAHAAAATSSIYMIPKSDPNYVSNGYNPPALLETKVNFEVKAGEPVMLSWQAFLNPKTVLTEPKDRLSDETCDLTSSTGEAVNYLNSSSIYGSSPTNRGSVYFPALDSAFLMLISSTSTNLVLKCRFHSVLSDGTLKVSKYLLTGNPVDSLPKNSSIDIKAGEIKVLTFQGKAGKQLTFKMDSSKTSICVVTSISELPNWKNNFFIWDDGSFPGGGSFGGIDLRGSKVATATKLFTPTANGTYLMVCKIYDGFSGTVRFLQKDSSLKLLRPQAITNETTSPAIETETTSPAKCPVAKAPSAAPKISVAPNGLWIEYTEPGFSDQPGCIDGFRVYAVTLNPYTKAVLKRNGYYVSNGTYSIRIADCEKRDKGLITCLIPNRETWLQTINSQDESSNVLAVNAVAVNSKGESEASPYALLFEKESALISAACLSMQKTFSYDAMFKTPIAYTIGLAATYGATHILTKGRSDAAASLFIESALKMIVAAAIAKAVSGRVSAALDEIAAKKFVEKYPVTALELLISMKNSLNPDVRAKSKSMEKAILKSNLMKIYQPLIGENNSLTSMEVNKIIVDEKLSIMKDQEIQKFAKNGAQEVKSLVKKNSNVKLAVLTSVSTASLALDGYLAVIEANQNNKSAVELVLPKNCNF